MNEPKKNMVASVLARLRNKAKGSDFNQLLQAYAMERFLYRVSKSSHAHGVVLKGALLLKTIGLPQARPTMDIDMLRRGKADRATLVDLVRECAAIEDDDGIVFLPETVEGADIDKDSGYTGTRVLFEARMANVRLRIQIDFGVGDVMVPGPRVVQFPSILNGEIQIQAYPVQSAVAEKLQAMVSLGDKNSRMKDFYDVWICSKNLDFDGSIIDAIAATFNKRNTDVPLSLPTAFTNEFVDSHRVQWNAFVKKIGENDLVDKFGQVVEVIRAFAIPAFEAINNSRYAPQWQAGKGWVEAVELDSVPTL